MSLLVSAPAVVLPPPLPRSFFARDALVVARALLGCLVVHEAGAGPARVARIVETEAYRGPRDLACHARAGLTKRTRTLLGVEGHAYVFLIYGMHDCFNVTCSGEGAGHAVLVRAGEPVSGLDPEARLHGPGASRVPWASRARRTATTSRSRRSPSEAAPRAHVACASR